MKRSTPPIGDDWVSRQLQGNTHPEPGLPIDRRSQVDRRHRIWWSVIYGSFNPRRRRPPRRLDDSRFHTLDWHRAHLLAVAIGILILNVADAFLTVALMSGGAVEANPLMAVLFERNPAVFAAMKMALTGVSVLALVVLAYHRFMRLVRVELILYVILVTYVLLIAHELDMLRGIAGMHLL